MESYPQMSPLDIREMREAGKTDDEIKAVSDERVARAQNQPVGQCKSCGRDIRRTDDYEIAHGTYWHNGCRPETPAQSTTVTHDPGCATYDGPLPCDCRSRS